MTRHGNRYARAALERELVILLGTPEGQRNEQLNRSVFAVARLSELSSVEISTVFSAAARRIGLEPQETTDTIDSALKGRR